MQATIISWTTQLQFLGSASISMDSINEMEQNAPNLILYALPFVAFFTLLEYVMFYFFEQKSHDRKETIGSVLIGVGNLTINTLLKTGMFYSIVLIYNLVPYRMEFSWWSLIPCFILYDFCAYWSHRISHYCRFFWATHVVHHSAEHYNLTVSFRQSWFQYTKVIFFIPLIFMGFHPVVFLIASQLSVLYQFWVHTESIDKLHPFFEKYFGTPSNHRVHHGSQEKYIDKNFGATFMIWDHWFNSFQHEEEKPVYGITSPLKSKSDPVYLNVHEFQDIISDVKNAKGLREKLYFVFASPGIIAKMKIKQPKYNIIRTSCKQPESSASFKNRSLNTLSKKTILSK